MDYVYPIRPHNARGDKEKIIRTGYDENTSLATTAWVYCLVVGFVLGYLGPERGGANAGTVPDLCGAATGRLPDGG